MSSKNDEKVKALLQKRLKEKRKAKKQARRGGGDGNLNLNSMMDMMTIILCFLLKSQGSQTIKITSKTDVPFSTSELTPKDMTTITIMPDSLVVLEKEVVKLQNRTVDPKYKKGGATSLIIIPLLQNLQERVDEQKEFARKTKSEFEGELTIIADSKTPYRLLVEVIQTSLTAEFKKFKFAVINHAELGFSGVGASNVDAINALSGE